WAITNFGNPDKLTITASQSVLDRHSERSAPSSRVTMELDSLSPGTEVKFDLQGLDAFVERSNARDNGDPNPFENRTLAGKDYKALARAFADMVGARVQALAKDAETGWRTPGKCVKLGLTGRPALLPPSGISRVTGTVTPVRQGVTEAGLLDLGTFDANYVKGPGSARAVATLPLEPNEPWYDFTAPGAAWPDTANPGLDVFFYSKGGIGREKITFPGGPDRIVGTFSGDEDLATSPGPAPWRLSWTGDVVADRSPSSVPSTTLYTLSSGVVHVVFFGTGPCELNGNETFDLLQSNFGAPMAVVTVTNGDKPTYTAGLAAAGAQITVTKSRCDDAGQNGQTFGYPLLATALIYSTSNLPVPSPPVYAGSATGRPTPADPQYHWTWNLQPG
ncbi:MAG: hypothetical protein QOE28_93, partial [Solirubrobacteraceae bacterium]|nr:hypothetical protein [Solirubrobacteraceae bacterium]